LSPDVIDVESQSSGVQLLSRPHSLRKWSTFASCDW